MDDLTTLRDLGRTLEHEPPASLARQRARLLDGSRPRRRMPRLMYSGVLLGAIAAVTAAAIVVPALFVHPNQPKPSQNGLAAAGPSTELNLLVMGVDRRLASGTRDSARTDTMMLVHLPADRKKVTVVSLPRDLMVRLPSCSSSGGGAHLGLISAAYAEGGSACAEKTVESATGMRIDHVVELDFSGLKSIVDALGGVEITLPQAVDDKSSGLSLPAGKHLVNGEVAVAYVRVRYLGDGSDLGRIERQQQFTKAMLKKAKASLTDPARLYSFVRASSEWIKTDSELDPQAMVDIARSLAEVKASDLRFVIAPWQPYPADPNRPELHQPDAGKLFASLGGKVTSSKN
jgi:LCP family protein required for cell wall assembly